MGEAQGSLPPPRQHTQVLAAALTFCFGLLAVRLALAWLGSGRSWGLSFSWQDPLVMLGLLALCATLVYLCIRGDEGDFRALFFIALVFFAGEEGLTYLTRAYGALTFKVLAMMMGFASAIYASLAMTAAAYDGPAASRAPNQKLAVAACGALLVLGLLKALGTTRKGVYERWFEIAGMVVLAIAAAYLLWGLLRSYRRPKADG